MPDGTTVPQSDKDALLGDPEISSAGGWVPPSVLDLMVLEEARASIRLDQDGDGQTIAVGPVVVGESLGTSGGVEITDELIQRLANEAEEGYDLKDLKPGKCYSEPSVED